MPAKKRAATAAKPKSTEKKPRRALARRRVAKKAAAPEEQAVKAAPTSPKAPSAGQYLYAVGRRKSAIARVRLFKRGDGTITVNGKPAAAYFPLPKLQAMVQAPMVLASLPTGSVSVRVTGGGSRSQAESVRHGLARALLLLNADLRVPLKRAGFLTRDPRVKERKKYGLKRARRAPQWQKR